MRLRDAAPKTRSRKSHRIPVELPVRLRTRVGREPDRALDLSACGLGLSTLAPLEPYSLISLHLDLDGEPKPVELLGRVMWATDDRMGVHFLQQDHRVARFVDQRRALESRDGR